MSILGVSAGTPTEFPPTDILNAPTGFNIIDLNTTTTTMNVEWTAPAQGDAVGYRIYDSGGNLWKTVDWPATNTTITGLSDNTLYILHVVTYLGGSESANSNTDFDTTELFVSTGDWQLADTYYELAINTMVISHPRPDEVILDDGGSKSYARHRKAYPGQEYEVPISIFGGSYPFKFELITAPAGMTVGAILDTDGGTGTLVDGGDYGVVTWPTPTAGTHTILVRVYDQEFGRGSTSVDVTWELVVGTSGHIFVDDTLGNDSTGTGSIGAPFKTINGWYKGDVANADYAGYHAHYRAGTYVVDNYDAVQSLGSLKFNPDKPLVHLSYPGETVVFDNALARISFDGASDTYIGGIDLTGSRYQNNLNAHNVWVIGVCDRNTFYDVDFSEIGVGGGNGWEAGRLYEVGEWVLLTDGVSYKCLFEHTSDATAFVNDYLLGYWLSGLDSPVGTEWANSTPYVIGDIVRSATNVGDETVDYQCATAHTSSASPAVFIDDVANWLVVSNSGVGRDNAAGVYFNAVARSYPVFSRCTSSGANDQPMYDMYRTTYGVSENIVLSGFTSKGLFLKNSVAFHSVRNVTNGGNNDCNLSLINCGGAGTYQSQEEIETSYCNLANINSDDPVYRMCYSTNATLNLSIGANLHLHHCTGIGKVQCLDGSVNLFINNNIIVSDDANPIPDTGIYRVVTQANNIESTVANSPLDVNNYLTGSDRTTYLGLLGSEIKAVFI